MTREDVILKDALRYIQMPADKADDTLKVELLECYEALVRTAKPRWTYQKFDLIKDGNRIGLKGTKLEVESKDLARLLKHCEACYILAATLGLEADRMIHRAQMRHMGEALYLDACANVLIEEVCDEIEQALAPLFGEEQFMTMRYSPGYGDVPLAIQGDLLNVLNTQKVIGQRPMLLLLKRS